MSIELKINDILANISITLNESVTNTDIKEACKDYYPYYYIVKNHEYIFRCNYFVK